MIRFDDVSAVVVTRGDVDMSWTKDLPYGEVIVWDNSQHARDFKVYGRYVAAKRHATRDIIYFQDDDVRFHEHEALLDRYEPGVLVSNMYDQWIEDCGYYDLALVGLGSIMDNGLWQDAFRRYSRYYINGDDRFELDCDFIFGTLTRWKRIDFGHEILDIASDDTRLWKQSEQFEGKWRSIRRARALRRVVLAIMAKNEEQNLPRALNSAKGLFDKFLLLDTGSTDKTIEVADEWCADNGIPFRLHVRDFTDFGEMRNLLLEKARKHGEYLLLMDADEEFIDPPESWPALVEDGYLLHYDGPIDYAQPTLLSRNFPWRFDGIVHSALDVGSQTLRPRGVNLRAPLIRHHGEDRHGLTKLQCDVELLTQEIEAGNDVPRHLFLRGKAYEGLGRRDDAISDYRARIALSEGDEEAYYSRYRLGVLTAEHLNHFPDAVEHLMMAWISRPSRIEALRALSFYATALADATPYPEEDFVLVHRDLYTTPPQGE